MSNQSSRYYGADMIRAGRKLLLSARRWWRGGNRKVGNTQATRLGIRDWARGWGEEEHNLHLVWREALLQLRQLHGDVWNGTKFFLTLNGILMAGLVAFVRGGTNQPYSVEIPALLCIIGLLSIGLGIYVFLRHRQYYLLMMVRKALIEQAMGLYDCGTDLIDLTFPWNVERRYLERLRNDPYVWARRRLLGGKISWVIPVCYGLFGLGYIIVLLVLMSRQGSRLAVMLAGEW